MTSSLTDRNVASGRALRQERFEQMFGTGSDSATTSATPSQEQQQFTDPLFAAAARDALSGDSATFLRQSRQTRGE